MALQTHLKRPINPAWKTTAGIWRLLSLDFNPMKQPMRLVRLNLHLRADHLDRLTNLASTINRRKGSNTQFAEELELALLTGLTLTSADMLHLQRPYWETPYWRALGAILRSRRARP